MKKISMISMALMSSALVACGGGSGSPSKPNLCTELNVTNCDQVVIPSSSSSSVSSLSPPVNNILPFTENFAVTSATQFFTQAYKSLLNPGTDDLNAAFYYPTSGLDAGRIAATTGKLTIGNARFTLGQRKQTTGTHIDPGALPLDFKVNTTTDGAAANFPTTSTWGELDLTHPWKISFCVEEREALSGSASNQQFMVYVDNNQTTSSFSIHGTNSLVKQLNVSNFVPGKRVEINFPGDVLVGGASIDSVLQNPGRTSSFIQLRVPSAGVVTMSQLWVGYQSDKSTEPAANTCAAGPRVPGWNIAPPPDAPVAPTFEPGNNQLRVTWPVAARATTYTVAYNTVDSIEGATLIENVAATTTLITGLSNGTSYYIFVKAHNTGGASSFGPSAVGVPEVPAVAPETPTGLTIYGDSQRALVTWSATDGAENYSLALNTMNSTTGATETTGITDTFKRLTGLVNNTPYYVFVKAGNAVGDSAYTAAQVVTPAVSPYIYEANFDVTKDLFFGTNGPAVQTLGVDSEIPLHFIAGGGAGITIEEGGIRLASGGRFTIGQVVAPNAEGVLAQTNTTAGDTTVNGVLDLSGYYKIVIKVATAPDNAGLFQVYLDNNTASGGASIHQTTANSRLINRTASTITDGEEIVYEMTTNRRGFATSFIQLRTDSTLGAEGILISSVRIEAIDAPVGGSSSEASSSVPASSSSSSSSSDAGSSVAPSSSAPSSVAESSSSASSVTGGVSSSDSSTSSSTATATWNGQVLNLIGTSEVPSSGSVVVNEAASVTLNATGGKLDAASHNLFFAHQQIAKSDFVFTARIASVTGATTASTNSYRFGLMVMSDVNTAASYANLAAWADAGFYVNATPALVGSRGNTKTDNTRTRSDIAGLAVGNYIRIEVYDDGALKRVRRLTSTDGVSFTQANSTTDFKATSSTDNWFVGFYAAPGVNDVTIQFDNISITDYVAPVIP